LLCSRWASGLSLKDFDAATHRVLFLR
jgi:hypothetical protein